MSLLSPPFSLIIVERAWFRQWFGDTIAFLHSFSVVIRTDERFQSDFLGIVAELVDVVVDVDEKDEEADVHDKATDNANQIAQVQLIHHRIIFFLCDSLVFFL